MNKNKSFFDRLFENFSWAIYPAIGMLIVLFNILFMVAVVYVAAHFIHKFW